MWQLAFIVSHITLSKVTRFIIKHVKGIDTKVPGIYCSLAMASFMPAYTFYMYNVLYMYVYVYEIRFKT